MSVLIIPDVSEWQGGINWGELVRAGYPAAIVRAHNGYREDERFTANRQEAHAADIRALGLYQYLAKDRSPLDQAAEFVHTIGGLRAGEWPILDIEEGTDAATRGHDWLGYVVRSLGYDRPWQYSGESFYREQGLAHDGVPASRTWLAAYGQAEPTIGHELWQYTDARTIPGISGPCDASEFHGTVDELLAVLKGVTVPGQPAPTPGPTTHPTHPFPEGIHPGGTTPSARPLQDALKRTGWMDPAVPDADHYGPLTQAGVAGFNKKHGLADVGVSWDPAIGPRGWALLMTLAYPNS